MELDMFDPYPSRAIWCWVCCYVGATWASQPPSPLWLGGNVNESLRVRSKPDTLDQPMFPSSISTRPISPRLSQRIGQCNGIGFDLPIVEEFDVPALGGMRG